VFVQNVTKNEKEVAVVGRILTRVIFLDELEGFNSEDRYDDFACAFTPKNVENIISFIPNASFVQTNFDGTNSLSIDHNLNIDLSGVMQTEVEYVANINGNIECQHQEITVSNCDEVFFERFDIGENIVLEQNVEGVLGVELCAVIRNVTASEGKVVIKGTVTAGVSAVKGSTDGQIMQNNFHDFEFSKAISRANITEYDVVTGSVFVTEFSSKVEHREKPELVIEASVIFTGTSVKSKQIKVLSDAFSCAHEVDFTNTSIKTVQAGEQINQAFDIEGNVTMSAGSPFINRVLWAEQGKVSAVNIKPGEDRVTIEGVYASAFVYECEDKKIHSHVASVPFSFTVKGTGLSATSGIYVNAVPVQCVIKARRGKELLVDAKVSVNVSSIKPGEVTVFAGAHKGADVVQSGAAIQIHYADKGETLWNISKRTKITAAEILAQNPNLSEGVKDGDKIVIYRQRKVG
jgi:LysM repeat protein